MSKKKQVLKNKDYNAIPSIIPEIVFKASDLSSGAKLFYGMIIFLYRNSLECVASTYYFYTQLGRKAKYANRAIQLYISELYTKMYIKIDHKNGKRYLIPYFLPANDEDIAAFIPPEIVKNSELSSSEKLSYGVINYLAANQNKYYETSVTELANLINRSKATIYRHLRSFRFLKMAEIKKDNYRIKIYTINSYQEAIQKRILQRMIKPEDDPPEEEYVSTLTDQQIDYLRQLVGK